MFQFKQFRVNDDRCAMKVGTDGVLLGAWCRVPSCEAGPKSATERPRQPCVLDVGTGCGLIALMVAQRYPDVMVTAVEIDEMAASQAAENFSMSPFSDRLSMCMADFAAALPARCIKAFGEKSPGIEVESTYQAGYYSAIVSNPPFFDEDLLPPDAARAQARHTAMGLTFERLIRRSFDLLCDGGTLSVIIPKAAQMRFYAVANHAGFVLGRVTDVRTVSHKAPKRVLLEFIKREEPLAAVERDELVLMENGGRSADYSALCREFYL